MATKVDVSSSYQKITQLDHILLRADMYVGSKEIEKCEMFIPTKSEDLSCRMISKEVSFIPAFIKIFDEILVNAADNSVRDQSTDIIKVRVDASTGTISVFNNGKGIPVQIHEAEGIYIPEMIFGHLLTSSNFDDQEKKVTGGRNGFGAKLTNIYSQEFQIETHDGSKGLTYKQKWTNNMRTCTPAKISKASKKKDFTEVTFKPDLAKLNMTMIDEDTLCVLKKRVYDLTGSLRKVKVYYNDEKIPVASFKDYVTMYLEETDDAQQKPIVIYEKPDDRWEVAVALSDTGTFRQVSFVNSIATTKGGTHVNYVVDQIVSNLTEALKKKQKTLQPKPAQVKSQLFVFVNCLIDNPIFTGQTKEVMTLSVSKFGSTCALSDGFMKKLQKLGILENTIALLQQKDLKQLKKTDGAKRNRVDGILKLTDANDAGTRKSSSCTLFICEGDSAKSFAKTGIPVIKNGQDLYGVYPLKGKLLNVRDASTKDILGNKEMTELKQVLGLQEGKVYDDVKSLRYGHICCLVDSDLDGHHIKGLILNWLDTSFPSLLKLKGFVLDFISPIVKCTKNKTEVFHYTLKDYEAWKQKTPDKSTYIIKYFKGLGTSKPEDTKKYFKALNAHLKRFREIDDVDRETMDMAFSKKRVTHRKDWLKKYNPTVQQDTTNNGSEITIKDFVDKDLIEFSMYDNVRSIPSVVDGLKPGQRKILFTAFKTKLTTDIKVAQLAAEVSKKTDYRHGEQSLCETIIGLAQNFCGTNNIALLAPEGAFGTRLQGGKDAAAPRYIYTKLAKVTRKLFPQEDDAVLDYLVEDGFSIEPRYYCPIIPMVLVNGAKGIGFGYSTTVLSYNPKDLVRIMIERNKSSDYEYPTLLPWYNGFIGDIRQAPDHPDKYTVSGIATFFDKSTIEISELPVGTWTDSYKQYLEGWLADQLVKDYKEYHTDTIVKFVVKLTENGVSKFTMAVPGLSEGESLLKNLKLTTILHSSNMMLFSPEGLLHEYANIGEIMESFYQTRLSFYERRKKYLMEDLSRKISIAKNKKRFVEAILKGDLTLQNRKKLDIEKELVHMRYDPDTDDKQTFSYLLEMPLYTLTSEKITELQKNLQSLEDTYAEISSRSIQEAYHKDLENFSTNF